MLLPSSTHSSSSLHRQTTPHCAVAIVLFATILDTSTCKRSTCPSATKWTRKCPRLRRTHDRSFLKTRKIHQREEIYCQFSTKTLSPRRQGSSDASLPSSLGPAVPRPEGILVKKKNSYFHYKKPFRVRYSKKSRTRAHVPPGWVGVGWRVVW